MRKDVKDKIDSYCTNKAMVRIDNGWVTPAYIFKLKNIGIIWRKDYKRFEILLSHTEAAKYMNDLYKNEKTREKRLMKHLKQCKAQIIYKKNLNLKDVDRCFNAAKVFDDFCELKYKKHLVNLKLKTMNEDFSL